MRRFTVSPGSDTYLEVAFVHVRRMMTTPRVLCTFDNPSQQAQEARMQCGNIYFAATQG